MSESEKRVNEWMSNLYYDQVIYLSIWPYYIVYLFL